MSDKPKRPWVKLLGELSPGSRFVILERLPDGSYVTHANDDITAEQVERLKAILEYKDELSEGRKPH